MSNPVVSHDEWIAARTAFLEKEKEFTRLRDELSAQRRPLPWEKVKKTYVFNGVNGPRTLSDLFDGRSQLVVYHFMFPPEWDAGCPHCSFWADDFDGSIIHLNYHDVSMAVISRASAEKLDAYKRRMGWSFEWVSSGENDFNYDYYASFTPDEVKQQSAFFNYRQQDPGFTDREGMSAFYKDAAGQIFHTYSTYARGIDITNTAYHIFDMTAKGRDENGRNQYWIRRHDEYRS